jgi:polysaccharide pyruvyl transferase WcaK-like protein
LDPQDTSKRHQIGSFPLTALSLPYYAISQPGQATKKVPKARPTEGPGAEAPSWLERLKAKFKQHSLVGRVVKPLYFLIQRLCTSLRLVRADCIHTARAFANMSTLDLLVVSGGGQLDDYWGGPWGHPYALLKWTLLAKIKGVKVAFMSVGTCAMESRLSRIFIHTALRLADYRSYRDPVSKRLLANLAVTQNDPVVPDLAFSFPKEAYMVRANVVNVRPVIGISPIAYLSPAYWPKQQPGVYERYLAILSSFIAVLDEQGYRVMLFSSASPDRSVIHELQEKVAREVVGCRGEPLVEVMPNDVESLLACLSQTDVVVASRLHGILLSHMLHKPVLAISYDRKVDTHMQDMNQCEYCIDIHTFTLELLIATFADLSAKREHVESMIRLTMTDYQVLLEQQFDQVITL